LPVISHSKLGYFFDLNLGLWEKEAVKEKQIKTAASKVLITVS
jgi:hypothetical protein